MIAGLYWYHPHVMSAAQVGFGLYGALLVDDPADGVGVADQLTLVLSDIGFDRQWRARARGFRRVGRDGVRPRRRLRPGQRQDHADAPGALGRAAALANRQRGQEPFLLLDLDGQPFYVIGGDGGLQERPQTTDSLLITPGERVDVIVTPTGPRGGTLTLRALLVQPRLRQRRISHSRKRADDCLQR